MKKLGRPLEAREERACVTCGVLFVVKATSLKKFCCHGCYTDSKKGRPILPSDFLRAVDRSYMQTEAYRATLRKETTPEYKRFAGRVHRLSWKTFLANEHILNPHGYKRGVNGVEGAHQIDHKFSIWRGFKEGWTPEQLAEVSNLQFIPWQENIKKGRR